MAASRIANDERLRAVAARQPYPLLFVTVGGAHLYGFPSPDSDYDLRGVHLLPVREVVGLDPGHETVESSGLDDGLEIDLVTHDVRKFFGLRLPYVDDLIARKVSGPEKAVLEDADVMVHERAYERLQRDLEEAHHATSRLPDVPSARPVLDDLLVRLRLQL